MIFQGLRYFLKDARARQRPITLPCWRVINTSESNHIDRWSTMSYQHFWFNGDIKMQVSKRLLPKHLNLGMSKGLQQTNRGLRLRTNSGGVSVWPQQKKTMVGWSVSASIYLFEESPRRLDLVRPDLDSGSHEVVVCI